MSYFAMGSSVAAMLLSAVFFIRFIRKGEPLSEPVSVEKIDIRRRAFSVLVSECKNMCLPAMAIFSLLFIYVDSVAGVLYIIGLLVSILCEIYSIYVISTGTARTAQVMEGGDRFSFFEAFKTSASSGFGATGLVFLTITIIYWVFSLTTIQETMAGFGMGIATAALFHKMSARFYVRTFDIIDSFAAAIIATMTMCFAAQEEAGVNAVFTKKMAAVFPLVIMAAGVGMSLITSFFLRFDSIKKYVSTVGRSIWVSAALVAGVALILAIIKMENYSYGISLIIGLIASILVDEIEYRTKISYEKRKPLRSRRDQGLIRQLYYGMISAFITAAILLAAVFLSIYFAGYYGLALAAVGATSMTGMLMATDSFLPVLEGAIKLNGRIEKLAHNYKNTTLSYNGRPVSRNASAIVSSSLASVALMASYVHMAKIDSVDIIKPLVFAGIFVGAMYPVVFTFIFLKLKDRYIVFTGGFAMAIPVLTGVLLGPSALVAAIIGAVASGVMIEVIMSRTDDEYIMLAVSKINIILKLMAMEALAMAPAIISEMDLM